MNRASTAKKSQRRLAWIFFAVLFSIASISAGGIYWMMRPTLPQAQNAFANGDYPTANKMIVRILRQDSSNEALLLGAKLARIRRDDKEAERLLKEFVDEGPDGVDELLECGKLWGELGRLGKAEEILRMVLKHEPRQIEANDRLLDLYRMEGRNWEAYEVANNVFPQQHFVLEHLQLVGTIEASWLNISRDMDFLAGCEKVEPKNPLSQMGPVRLMLALNENVELARELLLEFVVTAPELCETQVMLGELLFDGGEDEEFLHWHANLPAEVDRHPSIWVLRGRWAQRQQDVEGAIRCLWESIRRFPNDRSANLLMARLLSSVGREKDAAPFQRRGDLLLKFDNELLRGNGTTESLVNMISTLEELDRRWEAIGWCQMLLEVEPNSQFAQASVGRLASQLNTYSPLTPDSANPALAIDLSDYRIPELPPPPKKTDGQQIEADAVIGFVESASEVGLNFQYLVDHDRMKEKVYTFDFAGGGVGVVDFDSNGWPDLYLTQSRHWPSDNIANEPKNSLFQNQGGSFIDVAELAGVADQEFGQGTAVGDFNVDGFPDLYVTNLGGNVLYLNNGDGTFDNTTTASGTAGDGFSLSAAFADLSGDGLPDLYVVNYLGGDAMELQCEIGGRPTQCAPLSFPGQPDRLYLNLGDGRFQDISSAAGIPLSEGPGKGMGVLVADFDSKNGLDIYVTNDTMANRLYLNQGTGPAAVTFIEGGRAAGVAYDARGRLQGSMGIAAADVNRDQMLDVVVTNFRDERNNFFSQLAQTPLPLYNDIATEMNVAQLSASAVGWGAQFIDAELDGDWDLFVANGDLDEYSGPTEAKQKPHMFENLWARFRSTSTAGDYFQQEYFGRAVATLDWNRDGLQDLCVTHRGSPVALLTNQSERLGNFFAVELRGVVSGRDAIGASIEVEAGGNRWTVPMTGGSGFSATNHMQMLIGLGKQTQDVDKLTIRWPLGEPQVFENLPLDSRWLVVEGDSTPHPLPE